MTVATSTIRKKRSLIDKISWQRAAVVIPFVWLVVLFLAPFLIILKISFADPIVALPPFTPLFDETKGVYVTLDNYRFLFQDKLYVLTYLSSLKIAVVSTFFCLLLGYPIAYGIARARPGLRTLLLLLVIVPFWISFLLRVYAWIGILNTNGILNNTMIWLGLIDQPINMLYTDFAVYLGIVYTYLPFMILPLYASLERLNPRLNDAAADLGARPRQVFWDVTLPLSMPGVFAGCLLVFIPATGEFVIPALLGGPDTLMIGRVLFDEFFVNRDWPVASSVAIILLILLVAPIMAFQHHEVKQTEAK